MKKLLVILVCFTVLLGTVILASEAGKLLIWTDEVRKPTIENLGKQFTKLYGVPVTVQEMSFGDIRDKLGVAGPAGKGPDLIIGAHDWLGQLVVSGLLEPLEFMQEMKGKFVKTAVDAFTYGGKIYGLPFATEAIGLIYNKDLVPTPPKTFKELEAIAKKLTHPEKKEYGFITQASQPDPYHSFPFFTAYGGYIFGKNPDGTLNPCDIGLDTKGAVKGAYLLLSLIKKGLVPEGIDYQTMTSLFNAGKIGMILTGPWAVGGAVKSGINVGVAKIPTVDGNTPRPFVGVQGFMMSNFSKNKALAAFFLKDYVATKDTMLALYKADPRAPAFKPALTAVAQDPIVKGFAENIAVGIPMPSIPQMSAVWTAWANAISLFCTQKEAPEKALSDAVISIKKTIKCH
ncbi:MAG: maltose/maltodextrin ABC transporter substrate-binding protein MalE [Thermotoga sp.]|nr:MAG: maltose/maltodextrin ABC transporter substrate-binding protein MalE [Thermotoga sp.]